MAGRKFGSVGARNDRKNAQQRRIALERYCIGPDNTASWHDELTYDMQSTIWGPTAIVNGTSFERVANTAVTRLNESRASVQRRRKTRKAKMTVPPYRAA